MKRRSGSLVLLVVLLVCAGCGGDVAYDGVLGGGGGGGGYSPGEGLGATPGGAQDIAYARTLIEEGQIPPADAITVEGLLSEHDLPVAADEPCDDLLCVRPALGIAPSLETGENEAWVQLGMVSGIKASEFQRPPLDAVVLIDRSSSMSIDMDETAEAVNTIIRQLNRNDRLSVLAYNSGTRVIQEAAFVSDIDRTQLQHTVRGIKAKGSSDLEAALESAYGVARRMGPSDERMSRVYLLSCGYPSTNTNSEFVQLVKQGAEDGIGLTFLGVLLSYDYTLADAIGNERGGNYFYADSLDRVDDIFRDEFDFISTPLVYDLKMKLGVGENYEIAQIYGLPGEAGEPSASVETSTAFASKRKGAIVARLRTIDRDVTGQVATVSWSYTPETAHGFTDAVQSQVEVENDRGLAETHYKSNGVRKAVALVNMAERMEDAILAEDVTILEELRDYLEAEAIALDDAQLLDEVRLVEKLIALF